MPEQRNLALESKSVPLDQLRSIAASGELYAIADASDAPAVPRKVLELGPERAVSLYRGTAEEEFWEVAPYLMHVDPPALDWILSTLDLARWGIFAASKADLKTLRTHFRHFLKVQPPDGDPWLFRFYDPRVLRPFLISCLSEELRTVFGPAQTLGRLLPEASEFFRPSTVFPVNAMVYTPGLLFQLRPEHLVALQPQAEMHFASEVMEFLQKARPALISEFEVGELREYVTRSLQRARQYGFRRNSSLAAFVLMSIRIGPTFDQQPTIATVLHDLKLPPDLRLDTLVSRTIEEDWQAAATLSARPGS